MDFAWNIGGLLFLMIAALHVPKSFVATKYKYHSVRPDLVELWMSFWFAGFWAQLIYFIAGFMSFKMTAKIKRQILIFLILGASIFSMGY